MDGLNRRLTPITDDYNTTTKTYQLLKKYVPEGKVLYDPFYNDGSNKKKMEDVFKCDVIHENRDAFEWFPENIDIIITNPPFSIKYKVLDWLIKLDKPFCCLLPLNTLGTKKYSNIKNYDKIQYITSTTRIKYDRTNMKQTNTNFESGWFCYKMGLPKDIIIEKFL